MPAGLLILLYLCAALLPLGLAWAQGLEARSIFDELASGAGILALAVILAEFLLLGRYRFVARRVGTDIVMRMHQLLARGAAALAVAHPFLYTTRRAPAPDWDVGRQFFVTHELSAIWPGMIAWLLLPALVLMAIGRNALGYRYETWRLMHGLGAALIAGFGVLHTLRAGRYSADPTMATVWLALLGVALFALAYVYVLTPLAQLRRPWRVAAVAPVAERTWEVTLRPARDFAFRYRAGQFAWLNIGHRPFGPHENPFSISSAPSAGPEVSFIIKELGDFTRTIGQVKPGTRAYLDGPHGHLTVTDHKAPGVALIAGGVGIAPMMGILRELHASGDTRPTALIYGNRNAAQIACRDELEELARAHGTRLGHVLCDPPEGWTGEVGFVTPELLRAHFGDAEHREWLYVLCGPPAMLEAVEDALIGLGVPSGNILSERFSYD
ncbi:ferredoxin reductase family protein [Actibacterium sp. MT2.3-13A]|uniref:ferredoxin reductase family protein n=1 Tax=Actibacterium sp. MT2.3-13A TaxID=2828332 RepID=UPI001BAD4674|nr:ferredoxin reductase family protein [Actibacterium sp. MT2.3-13A]